MACVIQSATGYKREDTPSCISFARISKEEFHKTLTIIGAETWKKYSKRVDGLVSIAEESVLKITKNTSKGTISLKTSMFPGFILNTGEYLFLSDLSYTLTRPFAFIQMDIPDAEVQGMGGSPLYSI